MKLGLMLGYWGAGPPADAPALAAEAERLGFDSIWVAESWGSDALTPLAWWGAGTSRLRLGTSIMQLAARTPAAAAMAALTLDHLCGGRFVLGLGVSGPQVVEGWYGVPYDHPLARTREYVEIIRRILARRDPVEFHGRHYTLPYPGGTGLGKPLRSITHPLRPDIPILLTAEGPKNVALAAEIADGWLAAFYSPGNDAVHRQALDEGFARPGARRSAADFEVMCSVPVAIGADAEAAADTVRPHLALYIGGMGARSRNFHREVFVRLGYEAECEHILDLYLSGHKPQAEAAVPLRMVEEVALVGPAEKIRDDLARWRDSAVTTMAIAGDVATLRTMAELVLGD
jgi:F420-dependent oxidoreductase-like protein